MTAATYTCPSCSARVPVGQIERIHQAAGYSFREVPRAFCEEKDCPGAGAVELRREPPLGGASERQKAHNASKLAEYEHEELVGHLRWALRWITDFGPEPLPDSEPESYERWIAARRAAWMDDGGVPT